MSFTWLADKPSNKNLSYVEFSLCHCYFKRKFYIGFEFKLNHCFWLVNAYSSALDYNGNVS